MADEPLRTTTYTLTRVDALAYEQAADRMTPLGVLALLCWLGLWGGAALLLPDEWTGPHLGWPFAVLVAVFVAVAYVLALLLIAVRHWWLARRLLPRPVEVTLNEWPDRLDLVSAGVPRSIKLADVRRAVLSRFHLFLDTDEGVIMLPRRAFPEVGSVEALHRRIESTPHPLPTPEPAAEAPSVAEASA
jgi:hypothetical protein